MSYNKRSFRFEVSFTFKDKSGADRTTHAIWDILSDSLENAESNAKLMLKNYSRGQLIGHVSDI